MHITLPDSSPLPCAVPVCGRGPGVRASSPQAAKMAALPGSGQAGGPRRGLPDRAREAHATMHISRPKRGCVLLPSLGGWPGLSLVSWTVDVWNSIVALWQVGTED